MKSAGQSTGEFTLERVSRDIAAWRQNRPKLGRMPEPLWEEATAVARMLGVYPVARALRLNYGALKLRVDSTARRGGRRARREEPALQPGHGRFVEVSGVPLLGGLSDAGAVVEVVAPDGARLTIRLKGTGPDIAAWLDVFRERG